MSLICFGKFYDSKFCEDCSSYYNCEYEKQKLENNSNHLENLDILESDYQKYPHIINTINYCSELIKEK